MNIPISSDTVNIVVKWLINQGLAIGVLAVIVYFDRQEKADLRSEMRLLNTEIKGLNMEIKTALKSDRDTLLYTLRQTNDFIKKSNGQKKQ
jgi:hypothetical protein